MSQRKKLTVLSIALTAFVLALSACDSRNENASPPPHDDASASWKLDAMPDGGVEVVEAKAGAGQGDAITIIGRVGGRSEPVSASSGLFIIMDRSLPSCADEEGDNCATPWDYCCETPETITANAATVQLRDAEGKPITLAEGDIRPLSQVAVVGTVGPRANGDTLIIHATGVHIIAEQ